jgi:hypothetical protein
MNSFFISDLQKRRQIYVFKSSGRISGGGFKEKKREARSEEPEARSEEPEARSQKSEARSQEPCFWRVNEGPPSS